jgi:hypothetical protein
MITVDNYFAITGAVTHRLFVWLRINNLLALELKTLAVQLCAETYLKMC